MPRDIPVGNGNLLITFDQDYCLRDIYYPYVGQENHTGDHKLRNADVQPQRRRRGASS